MSTSRAADAPSGSGGGSTSASVETSTTTTSSDAAADGFDNFYALIKEIEKRDSVLTSAEQISRLLRPGSSYANLNPFDVLQIEPDTPMDACKKQFRKLSMLVHPDKNATDSDRAQQAFDAVNKAWKMLEDEEERKKCLLVVEEARARTDQMIKDKRKKLKAQGHATAVVDEDQPDCYRHAVQVLTMKLFADHERKRRERVTKQQHEKKRKAVEESTANEQKEAEKTWNKNYEATRVKRVESWRSFQTAAGGSKKTKVAASPMLKMPKHKQEKR